jgi:hypothetical protein
MQRAELVAGGVVAAVGAFALVEALDLAFIAKNGVPGPGFFPTLLSGLLLALGVVLAVLSLRSQRVDSESPLAPRIDGEAIASPAQRRAAVDEATGDGPVPTQKARVLRAGSVWLLFAVAVGVLSVLGFVPTIALLIAALLYGVERRRDWRPILVAVLVPVASYELFVHLLDIPLPTGLLLLGPFSS